MECWIGLIKNINEDNYNIQHSCDNSEGLSGGPLINPINIRVIGINRCGCNKNIYNLGTFLKEPI